MTQGNQGLLNSVAPPTFHTLILTPQASKYFMDFTSQVKKLEPNRQMVQTWASVSIPYAITTSLSTASLALKLEWNWSP